MKFVVAVVVVVVVVAAVAVVVVVVVVVPSLFFLEVSGVNQPFFDACERDPSRFPPKNYVPDNFCFAYSYYALSLKSTSNCLNCIFM